MKGGLHMWTCNKCQTVNQDDDDYCIECGANKICLSDNCCSNPDCVAYGVPLNNATQRYCGKCGSATTYWAKVERAIGH